MMGALVIKKEVATTAASDPALLATDLADELVRKNVPFRAAHDLIGKLAAESSKTGVPLDQLPVEVIREYCPQLLNDWKSIFDPIRSLKARAAIGAPSPANVSERLAHWKKLLG